MFFDNPAVRDRYRQDRFAFSALRDRPEDCLIDATAPLDRKGVASKRGTRAPGPANRSALRGCSDKAAAGPSAMLRWQIEVESLWIGRRHC
jgi:hypothetical protein